MKSVVIRGSSRQVTTWVNNSPPVEATTDAAGRFRFHDVASGTNQIQIRWGKSEPAYQIVTVQIGPFISMGRHLFGGSPFIVQPGANMEGVKLTVARRIRIRGRILYADGTPLANARLRFAHTREYFERSGRGSGSGTEQTDAEGYYQFFGREPAFYTLSVEYEDLYASTEPIRAEESAQINGVDLILDGHPDEADEPDDGFNPTPVPSPNVPTGWVVNPTNGHAYRVISGDSWQDCEKEAALQGAHLVTINNPAEQHWLVTTFGGHQFYWIGLTDEAVEGVWKWVSGESGDYINWAKAVPDNLFVKGEDYAIMNWTGPGRWNDVGVSSPEWDLVTKAIIEKAVKSEE